MVIVGEIGGRFVLDQVQIFNPSVVKRNWEGKSLQNASAAQEERLKFSGFQSTRRLPSTCAYQPLPNGKQSNALECG